jgi:hypothetical protein
MDKLTVEQIEDWRENLQNLCAPSCNPKYRLGDIDALCDMAIRDALATLQPPAGEAVDLQNVLLRAGFVRCDIPACNCGSWHHRYGLPERWNEIKDALREAGVLDNSTGNLPLNAINKLIQQRDAALAPPAAPAQELTITDAMLDAGMTALDKQYHAEPLDDAVAKVCAIYIAMQAARSQS